MPNSAPTIIDISRAGATRLSGAPISAIGVGPGRTQTLSLRPLI